MVSELAQVERQNRSQLPMSTRHVTNFGGKESFGGYSEIAAVGRLIHSPVIVDEMKFENLV